MRNRVAVITKRAKAELEALRDEGRELSERLIEHYREVLGHLDPRSMPGDDATALAFQLDTLGLDDRRVCSLAMR